MKNIGYSGQYPSDGNYRMIKATLVNGVTLQPGDALPADAAVRTNSRRLETMCRARVMELVDGKATGRVKAVAAAAGAAPARQPVTEPEDTPKRKQAPKPATRKRK